MDFPDVREMAQRSELKNSFILVKRLLFNVAMVLFSLVEIEESVKKTEVGADHYQNVVRHFYSSSKKGKIVKDSTYYNFLLNIFPLLISRFLWAHISTEHKFEKMYIFLIFKLLYKIHIWSINFDIGSVALLWHFIKCKNKKS